MHELQLVSMGVDYEVCARHDETGMLASAQFLRDQYPKMFSKMDGGMLHPDGSGVELSTYVAFSSDQFSRLMREGVVELNLRLKRFGFSPMFEPEATFDTDLLGPSDWEVGCNPYWNVYDGVETVPQPYQTGKRFFSGHIHLGIHGRKENEGWVAGGGLTVGEWANVVMAVEIEVNRVIWDNDETLDRRKGYGAAGNVRFKNYGIEVRSPSCAWVKNKTNYLKVWRAVQKGVRRHEKIAKVIDAATWRYIHDNRVDKEAKALFNAVSLIKD